MALNNKKRSSYECEMTYAQGLISGLILLVIIAAISPLNQWITSYVITPKYFPNVIKRSVELDYFKTSVEAEAYFNYPKYATQGAIGALIMGVFTTAIAMIFVRKK